MKKSYPLRNLLSLFFLIFLLANCTSKSNNDDEYNVNDDDYEYYEGTYCAEITYYNPNTNNSSTYDLEIEVENNELIRILWLDGGWLDQDHFNPIEFNEDGYCEFTSDKGYDYAVKIIGKQCTSNDLSEYIKDREDDEKKIKCDRCGEEKSIYAEYCDDCIDAFCSNCGQFDDYKYLSYDLCSDCERKKEVKEKTCQRCGKYDRWMSRFDDLCSDCD